MPLYLSVPFVLQAMDLYLAVLMGIFGDQSHQLHARMVRGEGLAYVPLETVTRMVNKLLPLTDKVPYTVRVALIPSMLSRLGEKKECSDASRRLKTARGL